jgi:hypothetical protein
MTLQQTVKQAALAAKWGKGLITFPEYHVLMYEFYEA